MKGCDIIEFYLDTYSSVAPIAVVESSMPPQVGEFVNIKRVTYLATRRSFALDYAGDSARCFLRCNVDLTLPPPGT